MIADVAFQTVEILVIFDFLHFALNVFQSFFVENFGAQFDFFLFGLFVNGRVVQFERAYGQLALFEVVRLEKIVQISDISSCAGTT